MRNLWRATFLALIIVMFNHSGFAQTDSLPQNSFVKHRFSIVAETPVMYGLGYEFAPHRNFSIVARYGLLTQPNISMLLWLMEQSGSDTLAIDLLRETFQFGQVASLGISGNYKGFYLSAYAQLLNIKGEETAKNLAQNVLAIDINTLLGDNPLVLFFFNPNDPITVKSNLWQLGLRAGKRFKLNENWDLNCELAYSLNISSTSTLESSSSIIDQFSAQVEDYLKTTYKENANIAGINVCLAYKF